MHNSVLKVEMEEFYNCLQKIIRHGALEIPSIDYDLVLNIMPTEGGRVEWSYYYACHKTRCLFWLDPYDASHMISEVYCVTSPAHVSESQILSSILPPFPLTWSAEHRLEALYWCLF
jgi:hypothetical protein